MQRTGWKLMKCSSNRYRLWRKNKIACLILDYEMPRLNGLQLLQILQRSKSFRNIPVIMHTAYQLSDDLWDEPVGKGWITSFFSKPAQPEALLALLDRICLRAEAGEIKKAMQQQGR